LSHIVIVKRYHRLLPFFPHDLSFYSPSRRPVACLTSFAPPSTNPGGCQARDRLRAQRSIVPDGNSRGILLALPSGHTPPAPQIPRFAKDCSRGFHQGAKSQNIIGALILSSKFSFCDGPSDGLVLLFLSQPLPDRRQPARLSAPLHVWTQRPTPSSPSSNVVLVTHPSTTANPIPFNSLEPDS
jgi:hypothetical protein